MTTPLAEEARVEHNPERPEWTCGECGEPWPCTVARDELRAQYRMLPTVMRVYLVAQYADAVVDLALADSAVVEDLYQRFVGWVRL